MAGLQLDPAAGGQLHVPLPGSAVALADEQRLQQIRVAAALSWQVILLWRLLDLADVRRSWPAIRAPLAALVRESYGQSARLAADYYRAARIAAGVIGDVTTAAPELPDAQLLTVLDGAGPYTLLGRIKSATMPLPVAVDRTATTLSGNASRLALSGGRDTIVQTVAADPAAIRWERVTGPSPCAFCTMLASRGGAYRSEASADFAAHQNCMCTAAVAFTPADGQALAAAGPGAQWREVTRGKSGKDALNAWRRHQYAQQAASS